MDHYCWDCEGLGIPVDIVVNPFMGFLSEAAAWVHHGIFPIGNWWLMVAVPTPLDHESLTPSIVPMNR